MMRLTSVMAALALGASGAAAAAEKTLADVHKKVSTRITQAQREAAAQRQAELRAKAPKKAQPAKTSPGVRRQTTTSGGTTKVFSSDATVGATALAATAAAVEPTWPDPSPMTVPGGTPDYFGSPNWAFSPPLRKFVDGLPGLGAANANNLGQFIAVAHPDTLTYPGSDYYEIELRQFDEKLHSDLPPTRLRGYVQVNKGTDANGVNTINPDPIRYLGPTIIAQRDLPVRIKFTNKLSTGAGGDLFIPVDTSIMGSGEGPKTSSGADCDPQMQDCAMYTQNRATLHLHGGRTPWISDGTPHQWITPAGEATPYPKGVSVSNVPDMPDPGDGSQTFFYTNQQSARLMFYHDHSYGITRLNVYAGEAAGYLIQDQEEKDLLAGGLIPAEQIPLIVQDKSFVDASTIRVTDPTWNWGTGAPDANGHLTPRTGDLWYPHVYSPAQNPYDLSGTNAFGRWHYGPWFWPPTNEIMHPPIPNPYYDPVFAPWEPPEMPATPNPSMPGESFMDTAMVNGTPFPTLTVQPKSYRFRILNAANDRFFNLQLYVADSTVVSADGRTDTEVKMVPAVQTPGFPDSWPVDNREGGVPDPTTRGPDFIQIATEGGFLPAPAVVKNQPIAWNNNPTTFTFGNVTDHALLVAPAERADVIVDFSSYAGKTLILYNDAPAAFPASEPRVDYYTGAPNQSDTGGHPGPQPGFGPNTRTVMQIKVAAAPAAPAFDLGALGAAFSSTPTQAGTFVRSQDPIVVGQPAYGAAYNTTLPTSYPLWGVSRIQDAQLSFVTFEPDGTTTTLWNFPMKPKAIHDEMGAAFDTEYGCMSGKLGLELPNASARTQNFVLQNFVDPVTEVVQPGGIQLWKISHNGVDTHPIHFHAFDVQVVNRVAWDGIIDLPDANELGWKDTVRISPLQDTIVALRPVAPKQPFGLPDSWRPLNPADRIGSMMGFSNVDPLTGQPLTGPAMVTNQVVNFGWEYVWHCHILSHEEDDMMRPISMYVPSTVPAAPMLWGAATSGGFQLRWTDATPGDAPSTLGNMANEIGFRIERKRAGSATFAPLANALANQTMYLDPTGTTGDVYRIVAYNTGGERASNQVTATSSAVIPATGVTLTPNKASPQVQGTAVTFTATGQGSVPGSYSYRFYISEGTGWRIVQDYGVGSGWTMPGTTLPGTYTVVAYVRTSAAVLKDAETSIKYSIRLPPATGVTLSAGAPSPQVTGTPVVFTAAGTGSSGYEYRFYISEGTGWRMVQDYGVGSTWTMPGTTLPGTYTVVVYVRTSAAVLKDAETFIKYSIRLPPATGVTLSSDAPSPQVAGTPVVFTAAGTGSSGYEYRFHISEGTGWRMAQDYGVGSTWTMPGTTLPGTYTVVVYVRTSPAVLKDADTWVTYTISSVIAAVP